LPPKQRLLENRNMVRMRAHGPSSRESRAGGSYSYFTVPRDGGDPDVIALRCRIGTCLPPPLLRAHSRYLESCLHAAGIPNPAPSTFSVESPSGALPSRSGRGQKKPAAFRTEDGARSGRVPRGVRRTRAKTGVCLIRRPVRNAPDPRCSA
jgi:hypothetical protein